MSVTKTPPVVISSEWFRSAYDRGLHSKRVEPTEENLVAMVRRTVNIALDDGEISEMQLRYEVGLLVGTLLAAWLWPENGDWHIASLHCSSGRGVT